jgi:hypothetical protein
MFLRLIFISIISTKRTKAANTEENAQTIKMKNQEMGNQVRDKQDPSSLRNRMASISE